MIDTSQKIETLAHITTKAVARHYGIESSGTLLALIRAALREIASDISGSMPPVAQPSTPRPVDAPRPQAAPAAPPATNASRRAAQRAEPTMPFGRRRGEKMSAADASDLTWMDSRLTTAIADFEQSQWRDKNLRLRDQVRAEMARRNGGDAPQQGA